MTKQLKDEKLIIFDGACGTTLQEMTIPAAAWGDCEGCNEYLNISAPEIITEMHAKFIDAGAMVLESNTFGASRIVLAEYGLEGKMAEINRAAVENARRAIDGRSGRYVAGSLGPTTKLVSLGHIEQELLAKNYLDQTTVLPQYEELKRRSIEESLIQPKVAYGYYHCYSEDNEVKVEHEGKTYSFEFPRRQDPPTLCISDFYKTKEEGGDIAAFFVVTIGEKVDQLTHKLFDKDEYHDYLMLHGFSVEVTDALAEYWHEVMRHEMGIAKHKPADMIGYAVQDYQGSRFGFGYPACPDLDAHIPIFAILKPEKIGVTLTENMEMVPEQTTSAIISHHPQAKYFAV